MDNVTFPFQMVRQRFAVVTGARHDHYRGHLFRLCYRSMHGFIESAGPGRAGTETGLAVEGVGMGVRMVQRAGDSWGFEPLVQIRLSRDGIPCAIP